MSRSQYALFIFLLIAVIFLSSCFGAAQQASVRVLNAPTTVETAGTIAISWEVAGQRQVIPHTAIYYDTISIPGTFDTSVTPSDAGYAEFTQDFASGEFTIPRAFTATFKAPNTNGTLYWRAHAVVNNVNYWSDEFMIEVFGAEKEELEAEPEPEPEREIPVAFTSSYFIEVDNNGFYIDDSDVRAIDVLGGQNVTITFKVRDADRVGPGGLEFRGPWGTERIPPNGEATFSFVLRSTTIVRAYQPFTNQLVDTLRIRVQ